MLEIRIICVGKLKEPYFIDAAGEYKRRLAPYCRLEIEELAEQRLPENPSAAQIESALGREAEEIIPRLPKSGYSIALCVEGERLDSPAFSRGLMEAARKGGSRIAFLIGGSEGLHEKAKARAERRLSISDMTFPHHLTRIMLLEQIYRAFKIDEGSRYHK